MKTRVLKGLAIILLCITTSSNVFADGYGFYIGSAIVGYNSDPVYKYPNHASAMVNVSQVLSGPQHYYVNQTEDTTRKTHFIVIASNGVQISNGIEIGPGYGTGNMTFYSAAHEGNVMLRANSTSTGVGYSVLGAWTPNN